MDRPEAEVPATRRDPSTLWAAIVFGAYLAVAFALLLFHYGRNFWFAGDDWGLIVTRSLSDPSSWMRPQNQHWLLVPTLVDKGLYHLVGLRSYVPYQAVVVGLHVTLAALARVVMRRAGVGPWTATIVAGSFVLLGAAFQEMLIVIMMGPLLSLVFGFVQLILADHDGSIDKRDVIGLLAGLVAISSSGLGPVMVVVVGLSALVRRGWRAAAFHTVPLGIVWVLWFLVWGREEASAQFDFATLRYWLSTGWRAVFESIGGYPVVAILLGAVLVAGLALAWARLDLQALRRRAAAVAALLVGAALFFAVTSTQRLLLAAPDSSRYIGWTAPMILPALGVATYAFIERWRLTAPFLLVLFVIGVPRSINSLETNSQDLREFMQGSRALLLAAAYSPVLDEVPADVYPDPNQLRGAEVTVGFLRAAKAAGRLPSEPEIDPLLAKVVETRLRLSQSAGGEPMPSELTCATYDESIVIDAHRGDQFGLIDTVRVIPVDADGKPIGPPTTYSPAWSGQVLTLQVSLDALRSGRCRDGSVPLLSMKLGRRGRPSDLLAARSARRSGDEGLPGPHGILRCHPLDLLPVHASGVDETVDEPLRHGLARRLTCRVDIARGPAQRVDDVGQSLGLGRVGELLDAGLHLRVDLAIGSGARSPNLSDLDDIPSIPVGHDSPHDAPAPIANSELAEADERTQERFAGFGVALEEDHLLERLARDLRVVADEPGEVLDRRLGEADVGTRLGHRREVSAAAGGEVGVQLGL